MSRCVVISGSIIHQSRAFVKLLPGVGVVGGQGVVGAGTDGAPGVVALGDGLLAIGTVAHVEGAHMVGSLTSLKRAEDTEGNLQRPQHSIVNGLSHGQGVSMRRNTSASPPIIANPRSLLTHM
jgi:hypothetical protein